MTYMTYYKEYAPRTYYLLRGPEGGISTWIDLFHLRTGRTMRVFTSEDDFLNSPDDWKNLPSADVLMVQKGGHFGYRALVWFQKFLREIYAPDSAVARPLVF